jgi:hypothetical protein
MIATSFWNFKWHFNECKKIIMQVGHESFKSSKKGPGASNHIKAKNHVG